MKAIPGRMGKYPGQVCPEQILFSVSAIVVSVIIAAVARNAIIVNFEIGAHASISFYAQLLPGFLLTSLTLTGLARLTWLSSLVGLTTRLATSSA